MSDEVGGDIGTEPDSGNKLSAQVRGSSLLLSGRLLAMAVNYLTQILIIRYLTKSDYGAFGYALSMVAVVQAAIQLGLDRGLARFLPIYDEDGDSGSIVGAISFVASVTFGLGALAIVGFWMARSTIEGTLVSDPLAVALLAILMVMAPVEALDNLLVTVLAAFRRSGTIFLRRHVVAPLLKLTVVVALLATGSSVEFLAVGYVTAAIGGLIIFSLALIRLLRQRRADLAPSTIRVPMRQLVFFSIPLLTTDLVFMTLAATDAAMLEWFGSTDDVAALRAVQPTARLSQVVLTAFGVLFIPYVARLYAKGQHEQVNGRYWETTNWVMLLSLPIVCATLLFPTELTTQLLGEEYADSAVILAILGVGYFIHAVFGFNGMTLNVYGQVRFLVVVNIVAVFVNVGLNLALVPRYGPVGAALGTAGTFVVHNLSKQWGILRRTGVVAVPASTWRLYGLVATLLVLAAAAGHGSPWTFGWRLVIWMAIATLTVWVGRSFLDIDGAFPELRRIPGIRKLF